MLEALTQTGLTGLTALGVGGAPGEAFPWLTVVTFGPMVGVLALMLLPREQKDLIRNTALICTLGVFAVSLGLLAHFDPAVTAQAGEPFAFQMTDGPVEWIPSFGIHYFLGVDGISLWLVLLTTFLGPIVVYSTYSAVDENVKEYMISLLFLQTGMVGALVSLDVFLFYVFWEMMLIPMYLIIGVWGADQRIRAAVKFFLYTMVGSLLMLVAILYVYFQTGTGAGEYSFLFTEFAAVDLGFSEQLWLFGAFFLAFAIKVPLFPFHTWLPLAHVQAPTAGSVILAGVLLKMGTYGLVRYAFPLFPDALKVYAPYIALMATVGVVYGALMAMVQDNVKSLVAYSSISHLGFCVLGLISMTPQGLAGGMYVMLAHGVATGGLFLGVGILYERRHTKKIADFGGIAKSMPVFSALFMVIVFASAGLPGLAGFVGEFLSLIGVSQSHFLWFYDLQPMVFTPAEGGGFELGPARYALPVDGQAGPEMTAYLFAAVAATGVIWAAGYLLWMCRRVLFGGLDEVNASIADLKTREVLYMLPIVGMGIFMGVFPKFFLSRMEPALDGYLNYMETRVEEEPPKFRGTVRPESPDPSWTADEPLSDGN
ncbi:MAG: NuoM family protein [Bradymonadaceae bacterium]